MALTNKKIAIIGASLIMGPLVAFYFLNHQQGPIVKYLPYINGSIFFLAGAFLFLISFGFYKPKYETPEAETRIENWARNRLKKAKFSSIFLMLFGAYNLIWHDPNMYRLNSEVEANKWTAEDKAKLLQVYTHGLADSNKEHPELVKVYCNCVVNKIMKSMGRQEYIDLFKLPGDKQESVITPLIKGCVSTYRQSLDSAEKEVGIGSAKR
jgi:hypothetical protein